MKSGARFCISFSDFASHRCRSFGCAFDIGVVIIMAFDFIDSINFFASSNGMCSTMSANIAQLYCSVVVYDRNFDIVSQCKLILSVIVSGSFARFCSASLIACGL